MMMGKLLLLFRLRRLILLKLDSLIWHHKGFLVSKTMAKGNRAYFNLEWEIYDNREWSPNFPFFSKYKKLFEVEDEGFYINRGFLFDWVDYSIVFYNKFMNILNKNKFLFLYPKRPHWVRRKYVPMRKKIYKNYLRISYSFGRYVRFYKSFIKIEYLLYMEPQYQIGQRYVTGKYIDLFSTFKFTKQLFIYFVKYNKKHIYSNIQLFFYKYRNKQYNNMFVIDSPYLWIPSSQYNFNILDESEYNINFDTLYTHNLLDVYYIYSNTKDIDRNENIIKLNDFKFVDWEYYTDGSGIYELNLISIDRLLEPWQLVNKYSLIEIYTCFILLYLNMTTKLN